MHVTLLILLAILGLLGLGIPASAEIAEPEDAEPEAEDPEGEEPEDESEEAEEPESSTEPEAERTASIPKPRFDEVNEKRIRAEAENEHLREQLRQRDESNKPNAALPTKETAVNAWLTEKGIDPEYASPAEIALAEEVIDLKTERTERRARDAQAEVNKAIEAEFVAALNDVQETTDIRLTPEQMKEVVAEGMKIAADNKGLRAFQVAIRAFKAVVKGRKGDALTGVRRNKAALASGGTGGKHPPANSTEVKHTSFQDALARSLKKHGVA